MHLKKPIGVFITVCLLFMMMDCSTPEPEKGWKAPSASEKMKNPLKNKADAISKGKTLYDVHCWPCHGESGYGDGAAGGALGEQPANFHDPRVKNQSDGSLFYKMSTGKENMPPYKDVLSETQRWQLVSYIRTFTNRRSDYKSSPKALRPDILVSLVMKTDSLAVRILQHPATKHLYYTTFDGKVYRIKNYDSIPTAERILTVADHGITRLQGAVFHKNSLYLCGNVDYIGRKTTSGRMVKYEVKDSVETVMTVVFNTVEFGANRTIYDHGWNALAVSPDEKYIFVNSGARTDHGEIQDNGGLFPGARDNALTSKIFRFPIDAKDLELPDDEQWLKAKGLIYAEGIRNAYDMEFDREGNLFAVSNSSDYDNPEDMFWVREGRHYGFPWVMGGIENPQQYRDWQPDPEKDPFIPEFSHSWRVKYFANDTTFPKIPPGLKFSPGVQNLGPAANEYRGHSGKILDGDITGVPVSTFTPHCSPLGLFFDTKKILIKDFNGDGFVIRYTKGGRSSMMRRFTNEGADLLHLDLSYDKISDNYFVRTFRIAEGFREPTDAIMTGNDVFIIEYGGKEGNIWKLTLPAERNERSKKNN